MTESILLGEQPFICLTTRVTQYSEAFSPVLGEALPSIDAWILAIVVSFCCIIQSFANRRTLASHMGVLMASSSAS